MEKAMPLPTMDEAKADLIRRALEETGGNIEHAAKLIKVGRMTVFRWKERACHTDLVGLKK